MSPLTDDLLAQIRAGVEPFMPDSCAILRPDYAGGAGPTAVATVTCRVVRFTSGGGANLLDVTGEATHTLHLPAGTDVRSGDELLVNAAERYAVLATNTGRSHAYDTQAACKRLGE